MKKLIHTVRSAALLAVLSLPLTAAAAPKDPGSPAFERAQRAMVGRWTSTCHKADLIRYLIDNEYTRETFTFGRGGDFERAIFRYADPACKDLIVTQSLKGRYKLGLPVVLEGQFGVRELDVKIDKSFASAHDQAASDRLSRASYCGLTAWRPGESREVTGKTCEGDKLEAGLDIADVVKLSGKELFLGTKSFFRTGGAPGTRPTRLDEARPYAKGRGAGLSH